MSRVEYFKASGAGNDFIVLPAPERHPSPEQVRSWCRRALSIGADGVIAIRRDGSETGSVEMVHWNADGTRAELCLNGSRCAARLAFELGWSTTDSLHLHTDSGRLLCRRTAPQRIALELPPGLVGDSRALTLDLPEAGSGSFSGWLLTVGVPHFVLPWPELGDLPIGTLGPRLRRHPDLGPPGANIDFVRFPSRDELEIRTFERGVEGETLACGSGVVAAVAVGRATDRLDTSVRATTAGGFVLDVRVAESRSTQSRGLRFELEGDARLVARGELLAEAETLPDIPAWSPAREP